VVAPVWEADPERWFRDIRVNLYGTFLCCRSFSRLMVARRSGYIINVLGGGISDPHPYSTSYASSKTGLMRLTEGLAAETREHGVKVFALAPPAVLTDMTRFIMEDPEARRWRPEFRDIFANRWDHPPGVVAEMAINLMSGRADALTGRCFDATADFDAIIAQSPDILEKDRLTLRVRR
jgi:NAD(P)-dependent dehydrogenase (short-subunit alcohol dehydrogenase family)